MKLLYFAALRDRVGTSEEDLTPPEGVADVRSLLAWLRERGAPWSEALADDGSVRVAVNQAYAGPDTAVKAGDEVAVFPPVTGG